MSNKEQSKGIMAEIDIELDNLQLQEKLTAEERLKIRGLKMLRKTNPEDLEEFERKVYDLMEWAKIF